MAKEIALFLRRAMVAHAPASRNIIREETETDLFGDSCLCGVLQHLFKLVSKLSLKLDTTKMALLRCLHEVKLIVDLMYEEESPDAYSIF